MTQIGFNMGLGLNYGMNGLSGMYGYGNMNFGYGNMNSMMNGMLYGGNYGSYGGYGGFGGFGGYMGMNASMSLPLYQYSNGQAWDTTLATNLGRRDPVYLDTNRDGKLNVETLKTPLSFDMNGDGIADRVLEWNTKDAQLVYDANGDGQINSGREMMNEVGINGEQGKYKNGWEKALDLFDTNKDGKLDAEELKKAGFWTDANGNGKVDEGELKSAAEMGIMSIDPKNGQFIQRDQIGNMNVNFGMGSGFGNYGFNPYGNMQQMMNPFGNMQQMMNPFGNMQQMMNPFGNMQQMMNPFGNMQQMMNPFGNMQQMMNPFGNMQQMMNPYGNMQQMMNPYGNMQQMMNPYGNTQQLQSPATAATSFSQPSTNVDQNKLLGLRLVFNSVVNSHEKQISRIDEPMNELTSLGWDSETARKLATLKIVNDRTMNAETLVAAGLSQTEAAAYAQAF